MNAINDCARCEANTRLHRVRDMAAEFGDAVLLREHCADEGLTLRTCQMPRGILVKGKETGWGCESPREGIREAIHRELRSV